MEKFKKQEDIVRKDLDKFCQEAKTKYNKLFAEYAKNRVKLKIYSKEIDLDTEYKEEVSDLKEDLSNKTWINEELKI